MQKIPKRLTRTPTIKTHFKSNWIILNILLAMLREGLSTFHHMLALRHSLASEDKCHIEVILSSAQYAVSKVYRHRLLRILVSFITMFFIVIFVNEYKNSKKD
jgi:hypothetical protein